jgi:hypothetical protein
MPDSSDEQKIIDLDNDLKHGWLFGALFYIMIATPLFVCVSLILMMAGLWWPFPDVGRVSDYESPSLAFQSAFRLGLKGVAWWLAGMATTSIVGQALGLAILRIRHSLKQRSPKMRGAEVQGQIIAELHALGRDLELGSLLSTQIASVTGAQATAFDGKTTCADDLALIRTVYAQACRTATASDKENICEQAISDVSAVIDTTLSSARVLDVGDLATVHNYIGAKYREQDLTIPSLSLANVTSDSDRTPSPKIPDRR